MSAKLANNWEISNFRKDLDISFLHIGYQIWKWNWIHIFFKQNNLIIGKLLDISEKGIGILLNEKITEDLNLHIKDKIKVNLLNNDFDCSISRLNNKIIGLQFKNITPDKMKVIMSIFTENMQPHYDNKKIQNYIITDNKESICA